ncbi:MAG: tRNA (adenosine(37)-N6)-threonylcarbamoyltransferase complex ATPase subunit type 1 TsaE [Planctomycetota bacterium]|nr:tRNA (adenosine(37)-N6)-threonylcarbamoyltransferase complex ATPase subunit type 1 TsaE [Planctomycetota bacterium]
MSERPTLTLRTKGEDQTMALGVRLAALLRAGDVVALEGDLGAGKTRLVRGIARGLGLDESAVSSPTFVIANVYAAEGRTPLAHVDAYRLSGPDDLPAVGWDRLDDGRHILAVEWAGRIEAGLPARGEARRWDIAMAHEGEEERRVTVEGPPGRTIDALGAARKVCRTCGAALPVGASGAFCGERCRLADLGKWLSGAYRISRPMNERDLEEG